MAQKIYLVFICNNYKYNLNDEAMNIHIPYKDNMNLLQNIIKIQLIGGGGLTPGPPLP